MNNDWKWPYKKNNGIITYRPQKSNIPKVVKDIRNRKNYYNYTYSPKYKNILITLNYKYG